MGVLVHCSWVVVRQYVIVGARLGSETGREKEGGMKEGKPSWDETQLVLSSH